VNPRLSIVTPLHNKGRYIASTIESVLGQTMPDLEMLVVENYSADDGPRIASEYAARDARVRLITAPAEVRGPGAARNCGLAEARGVWILFLDADDLLEPDYVEQRLSVLEKYPDAAVIAGPWKNFRDGVLGVLEKHFPNGWKPPFGPPPPSIYAYSPWALHAAMVRRNILGSTPWLPELDRFHAEDNAFWFRVLYGKTIHWNGCAGALYRKETNSSRDATAADADRASAATVAMLEANRSFLRSRGKRPSGAMAATAVRVLENLTRIGPNQPQLKAEIRKCMRAALKDTSLLDPSMLIRRLTAAVGAPNALRKVPAVGGHGKTL
jgi:hypothetical protein